MVCMIFGTAFFGYVIGSATVILTASKGNDEIITSRMGTLQQFMEEKKLPSKLQVKLRRHFRYYWQNAQVDGEIRVRLLTTDDEEATEVTVQAGKEQLDQFAAVMDYNEKGKIRVRGILEKNPEEFVA